MKYLLDTNVVIAILNDPRSAPANRLRTHNPEEIAVPAIVVHELYYGAFKSARQSQNVGLIDALQFQALEFDREDARHAGDVRAALARIGAPIGPYDVLIAGQARARGLILATHNTKEFARVDGLQVEDWH